MSAFKEYTMMFQLNAKLGGSYSKAFKQAVQELESMQKEIQELSKMQADISAFQKQQAAAEATRKRLEMLRQQYDNIQREMEETGNESADMKNKLLAKQLQIDKTSASLEKQTAKLNEMSSALEEAGINTALESTACADYEKIRALLENLDTYLLDIKHIDSRKHKEFTGVGNELILANALKLSEDAKKLVIRVPVIPGFNNTEAEILEIAKFAADLKNVTHIHLLPYHRLGYDKYIGLGREYTMGDTPLNTAEHIARLKRVAESTGLICEIGG